MVSSLCMLVVNVFALVQVSAAFRLPKTPATLKTTPVQSAASTAVSVSLAGVTYVNQVSIRLVCLKDCEIKPECIFRD